jgi:hypothetical protein
MKKQTFLALAAMLVLGLGAATLAYQQTNNMVGKAMSCCCCKGDSCPMKRKDASGKETASCCDKDDCCKGDSCPMKTKGEKPQAVSADMKNVTVVSSDEDCCCSCYGAKKDGQAS